MANNYPDGAFDDPRAPWNEIEEEEEYLLEDDDEDYFE